MDEGDGPAPIIILGAARSGTRFLRDVLAAAPACRAVPWDANFLWRGPARWSDSDRIDPARLDPRQRRALRRHLARLAGLGPGEVLVEKTVSNTLRVPLVAAVFPKARFVHLIRDGRAVSASALGQWQTPQDWSRLAAKLARLPPAHLDYALWQGLNLLAGRCFGRRGGRVWGPRYPGIAQDLRRLPLAAVCARQWRHCLSHARQDLAHLPPAQVFELRYETLITDPVAIEVLARGLGLDPAPVLAAWRAAVQPRPSDHWSRLGPEDRAAIMAEVGPLLESLGYG